MGTTEVIPANDKLPAATEASALVHMIERAARDPSVDIDKMDRLLVMHERMSLRAKEQEFNDAMAEAQAEMDPIRRDCDNPQTKSRYASYAALDRAVRPIYSKHGFGVSFNTQAPRSKADSDIGVIAYVTCKGFTRHYEIDMPADGKGAKGGDVMTRTHATGSGLTYGRRYLLQMIFNLATENADDDGNAAGGKPNQATPRGPGVYRNTVAPEHAASAASQQTILMVDDPSKPHTLTPLVGDTFEAWTDRFVACLDGAATFEEGAAWEKANDVVLGKVHAATTPNRPLYAKVDAAFARCKERVAKAQQSTKAQGAPTEAAGAAAAEGGKGTADVPKANGAPPPAAGDKFPEPWIKQTPATYVAWAEAWLGAAPNAAIPDSPAIDVRWDAERKIRNGLADKVAGPDVERLVELKGAAKARAKAAPYKPPTEEPARADGAGFSLPAATSLDMAGGDGKPAVTVVNPEAFVKHALDLIKGAKTGEELELVWNRDIEPHENKLLPPDFDELMGAYRRRERELAP